jgi:hypothetical protein
MVIVKGNIRTSDCVALLSTQGHAVLLRRPESAVPERERGHYEERIC